MKFIFSALITVTSLNFCFGQGIKLDENKSLQLTLIAPRIELVNRPDSIKFNLKIKNMAQNSLLLFGFRSIMERSSNINNYMQEEMSVGINLYVENEMGKLVRIGLIDDDEPVHGRPVSLDTIYNKIMEQGKRLMKDKIILKSQADTLISFALRINPKWSPPIGKYKLFLHFFSGKNVINLINESEIKRVEHVNNTRIYRGYSVSNKVDLILR